MIKSNPLISGTFVKFVNSVSYSVSFKYSTSYNNLGFRQLRYFTEHLQTNYSISNLKIWKNTLGDKGATELLPLLTHSHFLNVNLGDNGIGPLGTRAVATALAQDCVIRSLTLSGNPIGDDGAACLAQALASNTHLEHLNLCGTDIGPTGATALARAIQPSDEAVVAGDDNSHLTILKSLNVWGCPVEAVGAAILSDTLRRKNNTLVHLKVGPLSMCQPAEFDR